MMYNATGLSTVPASGGGFNWNSLVQTIGNTFSNVWATVNSHSGGSVSQPTPANPTSGTNPTTGLLSAQTFQFVTLGLAGGALVLALVFSFGHKR